MDWDYGMVAFSDFIDGVLEVAVDLHGQKDQSGRGLRCAQPLGLLARPMDPVADPVSKSPATGAGCLYFFDGDEGFAMPTTDPTLVEKVPQLPKGSTVLYSAQAFLAFNGETGDVVLRQPVGDKGQAFAMVSKAGEESIQIRHVSGANICFDKDGSVLINDKSGSGFIRLDGSGNITVSGALQLAGGAVLGDVAGAQPLVTYPTYATAMSALAAAMTALGSIGALAAAAAALTTAATACAATTAGTTTKVAAS